MAARVLESLDITEQGLQKYLSTVSWIPTPADREPENWRGAPPQLPFTPRAKHALELSLREALSLGHNYIGTEHILLGLIREEGLAHKFLAVEIDRPSMSAQEAIRNEVIRMLSGPGGSYEERVSEVAAKEEAADSHEYDLATGEPSWEVRVYAANLEATLIVGSFSQKPDVTPGDYEGYEILNKGDNEEPIVIVPNGVLFAVVKTNVNAS